MKKITRILLSILLASILGCGLVFGYYYKKTSDFVSSFTSESNTTQQIPEIEENPFVVFISGIDTAGDIDNVSRSDVNMVIAVNPATKRIFLADIPRDYYVPIHGIGIKDKLTHTGILGVDTTVATVEDFMNIDINYYIRVNFSTIQEMIGTIGGLEIESDKEFTAYNDNACHFVEGVNKVDGKCALAFARERMAYNNGDMHRAENQGQVIQKVIKKLSNPDFFLSHYLEILLAASDNLRTNISEENLNKIINLQIYEQPMWEVEKYVLVEYGTMDYGYFYPNQKLWMGEPDWETVVEAHNKIMETIAMPNSTSSERTEPSME